MDNLWHIALGTQRVAACVLYSSHRTLKAHITNIHSRSSSSQAGLGRNYEIRIYTGYVLVIVSYLVVVINLFAGCRPFHRNWQINPDPGGT